jgi:hypothetical protein
MKFDRFFFLPPLYLILPVFLWRLRNYRYIWILLTIVIFMLGTNLYPYFYSHYIAAIACLFVLMIVTSLERAGPAVATLVIFLCAAHFLFWYGLHFAGKQDFARGMLQFETEDAINTGDPQGRQAIGNQLMSAPGKQLVFVRYRPGHAFEEWVYNRVDIDSSRTVWAHDLGGEENEKLRHYYPDRTAWLLQPDVHPPLLTPYVQPPVQLAPDSTVPVPAIDPKRPKPPLRFEDVH